MRGQKIDGIVDEGSALSDLEFGDERVSLLLGARNDRKLRFGRMTDWW